MTATAVSQTAPNSIEVRIARTREEFEQIVAVRSEVFRDEQGIVDSVLTDSDDYNSVHAYALADGKTVAVGRLTPSGPNRPESQIAWVATLPEHRRQGAGEAIMRALLEIAGKYRPGPLLISAQVHAIPFYRRFGFVPYGKRFEVRGIEHQYMELRVISLPV
jgi:predicted GNAT family N-acyltransferase